jgi:hypothetical protein
MLVIAPGSQLRRSERIWGYGGWLPPEGRPPEGREALDWLAMGRLSGWGVTVTRVAGADLDAGLPTAARWIIVACDPDDLGEGLVARLAARLAAEPVLIVARAGAAGGPLARLAGVSQGSSRATGRDLRWRGPGPSRRWSCREALEAGTLDPGPDGGVTWATLGDAPLIAARRVGRGAVATLGFHPSAARDTDGAATALLRHLLIWGGAAPVAWLDLEGCLVLRMDDPGGSQNVYCRDWAYPKLGAAEWAALAADLKRREARLSIGYVAGWVDDGDPARGRLELAGEPARRIPGAVHPSPRVRYRDLAGLAPGTLHDYAAEYRGIQALRSARLGDVELHGYTHLHPDTAAWAAAPDRYEAISWYRELGHAASAAIAARSAAQHPLALGLAAIRRHFGVVPSTLICPGDQWTEPVIERALDLGLHAVSCYHLAFRHEERFCWTSHIRAPYLNRPDAALFEAGLPVVGYFHDRELALEGIDWLGRWLDQWQSAGARRLIDFRELVAALGCRLRIEADGRGLRLTVTSTGAPDQVRPIPVNVRLPEGRPASRVMATIDGRHSILEIRPLGEALGRVSLPGPSGAASGPGESTGALEQGDQPCAY